jgi:cyanophycin synthetase
MHPRNTCLCVIPIDSEVVRHLKRQGINLEYVPKHGENIKLRANSNVSTGGNCYGVTAEVNPFYIKFAKKILKAIDVPFVGIDLLTRDISKKSKKFVICELNSAPGLSLHMMPEKGESRDVASAIADVIFPETKKK